MRDRFSMYANLPFYASMFAEAGFPVAANGTDLNELIEELVISGDKHTIRANLQALLSSGIDELWIEMVPVQDEVCERRSLMSAIVTA